MKKSRFLIKTPNPDKPNGWQFDYIDGPIEYLEKISKAQNTSIGYRWNGSGWVEDRHGYQVAKKNAKGRSVTRG